MGVWQRWVRRPQTVWLRKVLFQIHLWTGVGVGLYIFLISVTGSVLVYRNELYRLATPPPVTIVTSGTLLTEDELKEAAARAYPGYRVTNVDGTRSSNQAVDIWLRREEDVKKRLFDPYTGKDLGDSVPLGIWAVSKLLELHDDLLGGPTGRKVNGVGAALLLVLSVTGLVIWWPGVKSWRRSLVVHRRVGWKRFIWELHGMIGFWSLAFIVLFGVTGLYLAYPNFFSEIADSITPPTEINAGERLVDSIIYWMAYLHFGRLGGRGISWCGRGLCDSITKAIWAFFGIMPAMMFVTGAVMWWTRVARPRKSARRQSERVTA